MLLPWCALVNPLAQDFDLLFGKCLAMIDRRHALRIPFSRDTKPQFTFFAIAWNNCCIAIDVCKRCIAATESDTTFSIGQAVALEAFLGQNGLYVAKEVDLLPFRTRLQASGHDRNCGRDASNDYA